MEIYAVDRNQVYALFDLLAIAIYSFYHFTINLPLLELMD